MTDHTTEREDIARLIPEWNAALQTGDPAQVVACYAEDAVLLPTLSKEIRQSHAAMADYFTQFLKLRPRAEVLQQTIRIHEPIATNSGIYKFFTTIDGVESIVMARFTFVYRKDGDGWKIIEHHSSMLPDV